jgi:alpha-ketoglutarate-dependent taurine dioxygenase
VLPFVQHEFVLDLVAELGFTDDGALQPFASNELFLHSEGSGRPLHEQPRLIILSCVDAGDDSRHSRTVVVAMREVVERVSDKDRAILSRTRYARNHLGPPILRSGSDAPVLSFRDFGQQPLDWSYSGGDASVEEVNQAFRALLEAMYQSAATAIEWSPGLVMVIDNRCVLHGRTRGHLTSTRRRHLMRVRIL